MLETKTDTATDRWLLSYAATHAGSHAVILINRDRDNAHVVPVTIEGVSGVVRYSNAPIAELNMIYAFWGLERRSGEQC